MPLPSPFPLAVVEALARDDTQQEEGADADADVDAEQADSGEILVFRSLVSLQRGALPTLCTPAAAHAWPDLLDYPVPLLSRPAATTSPTPDSPAPPSLSPFPSVSLPCASLLDFHAQVLEAQSAAASAPFGLALRSMSRAHRSLWAKLHVDEATQFMLTGRHTKRSRVERGARCARGQRWPRVGLSG